jgi:hypothetical protein
MGSLTSRRLLAIIIGFVVLPVLWNVFLLVSFVKKLWSV